MKLIAALLTVFNRKEQTLLCLEKLFEQVIPKGYELHVYLTDDGSTDGTTTAIMEQFPNKVNILQGDGSLYWNRGMWNSWNRAVQENEYDFYLWLNDDTVLFERALVTLLQTSEHYSHEAITVGATVDTKTHQVLTYGGRTKSGKIAFCNSSDVEVDYFNGNIVLVPNSVYKVLGNLDYYFTHSKGDFDYGLRARKANICMIQCGMPLGECDAHINIDKWCDPIVPFNDRWKMLRRPNGMPPNETFYLNRKHYGLRSAIQAYITIHLRCFFPRLWLIIGNK